MSLTKRQEKILRKMQNRAAQEGGDATLYYTDGDYVNTLPGYCFKSRAGTIEDIRVLEGAKLIKGFGNDEVLTEAGRAWKPEEETCSL